MYSHIYWIAGYEDENHDDDYEQNIESFDEQFDSLLNDNRRVAQV